MSSNPDSIYAKQRAAERTAHVVAQVATTPSRTPLSMALFEDRCAAHSAHEGEAPTDPVLGMAQGVRGQSAKKLGEIQASKEKITADPTRNTAALTIASAEYVGQAGQRQAMEIEAVRTRVQGRSNELKALVEAAMQPRDVATKELLPELRTALRTASAADRERIINMAKGGQGTPGTPDFVAIMYAIASAPAFLSGVVPGQREEMRRMALALRDPTLLTLPGQFEEELKLLDKCAEGFERSIAEIADFEAANALKQLAGG